MIINSAWFSVLRSIMELLYFASALVLAGAAIYGLRQLSITKGIGKQNARRESIKLAAERCQYFGTTIVESRKRATDAYKVNMYTFLEGQKFKIKQGQIVEHNFDEKRIALVRKAAESPGGESTIVEYVKHLNNLEAFAIPFVAGVADDEIGFQETASAFCHVLGNVMFFIFLLRQQNRRFKSCIDLYESWSVRIEAERARPLVRVMSETIKTAEKMRIPPLESQ